MQSINVEIKTSVGTVAWAQQHLCNVELRIQERLNERYYPCVAYRVKWKEKKEGETKELWHVLCFPTNLSSDDEMCQKFKFGNEVISCIYPTENLYNYQWGMFEYLTKAAHKVVDNFIESVAEKFAEWLDSDQGDIIFEVNVIKK